MEAFICLYSKRIGETMIGLITRPKKGKPKNCKDCAVKLDKDNMIKKSGVTYGRCKECNNKYLAEYNKKRQKRLKESKWF